MEHIIDVRYQLTGYVDDHLVNGILGKKITVWRKTSVEENLANFVHSQI